MKKKKVNIMPWLFNAPYTVYSIVFLFLPLIWAVWLSMTDWNLMSPDYNFVRFRNFTELFTDEKVSAAFVNSIRYLIPIVVLCFVLGVGIALMVSKLPSALKGFAAVMFFIPYLTSGVSTSVMVKYLFGYNSAFSTFLRESFGLNINWLQSEWAFYIIILMIVWKMSGYYALFVLSGIESISEDVYEAAKLDGADARQRFAYITLPMLSPTIFFCLVTQMISSFKVFDVIMAMTQGGPGRATNVLAYYIYNKSFVDYRFGYASSAAFILFFIILVMTLIQFVGQKKWVNQ